MILKYSIKKTGSVVKDFGLKCIDIYATYRASNLNL